MLVVHRSVVTFYSQRLITYMGLYYCHSQCADHVQSSLHQEAKTVTDIWCHEEA